MNTSLRRFALPVENRRHADRLTVALLGNVEQRRGHAAAWDHVGGSACRGFFDNLILEAAAREGNPGRFVECKRPGRLERPGRAQRNRVRITMLAAVSLIGALEHR